MQLIPASALILLLLCFATSQSCARFHVRRSSPISALHRLLAPAAAASVPDRCDGDDWGVSGQFELFVLAQSWSAEWCYPSSHRHYPGCEQPTDWQRANLTLHGLWPQYANVSSSGHGWPQCCNSSYGSELDGGVVDDELGWLQLYWPSEQSPSGKPVSSSLWAHEWAVHGTCSGEAPLAYLQLGLALMQQLPTAPLITQHRGAAVDRAALESAYNGGAACGDDSCMVWLQCSDGYLTELHTCWDRQLQQVECPRLVLSDSSRCTSSKVKISKFA